MDATELIETARNSKGASLRAAASLAGISEGRWRQIIKGADAPAHTLGRMAHAVGLSAHDAYKAHLRPLADVINMTENQYLAAQDMRHRITELAVERMGELELSPQDLQDRAELSRGVVQGFLSGTPWPTEAQLDAIAEALGWDENRVKGLIWSGKDPGAVNRQDLNKIKPTPDTFHDIFASLFGGSSAPAFGSSPASPSSAPLTPVSAIDAEWKAQVEKRLSRLEQALIERLLDE